MPGFTFKVQQQAQQSCLTNITTFGKIVSHFICRLSGLEVDMSGLCSTLK